MPFIVSNIQWGPQFTAQADTGGLVSLINQHRENHGLQPLVEDQKLVNAACWMAKDLVENNSTSETDSKGRDLVARLSHFGVSNEWEGETIAYWLGENFSASGAFTAWKNSPGHNSIMLGENYERIGVGNAYSDKSGWRYVADFASGGATSVNNQCLANGPDTTPPPTINQPPNTATTTQQETIADVTLPSVFRAKGSKTTNLSKISDPSKVKKLTFDVVGKSRIVFADMVNLSSDKARDLFKKLNKYVNMTKLGVVELNSKALSMLAKKKASVYMFNLPFVSTPKILVNGQENYKVVSNVSYKKGKLSFKVSHFSKIEAIPTLEITEPQNGFAPQKSQITLEGSVSDPKATVTASLNGQNLGELKVAASSGEFSKGITLDAGKNIIVVTANSSFGPAQSVEVSGTYTPKGENFMRWVYVQIALVIILIVGLGGGSYYLYKRKNRNLAKPQKQTSEQ
jgi:hypothetical protein